MRIRIARASLMFFKKWTCSFTLKDVRNQEMKEGTKVKEYLPRYIKCSTICADRYDEFVVSNIERLAI